jgi:hypothetical protein
MTLFIQLLDGQPVGYPIAEENFRQLFPYTSFPNYFTADTVESLGYGIYDFSNTPDTGRYEKTVEVAPVRNEYGIWRQTFAVVPMTDQEKSTVDINIATLIRNQRNARLTACDWTQVADAPVDKAAWAAYRQALRDLPDQPEFPLNIMWPEAPHSDSSL